MHIVLKFLRGPFTALRHRRYPSAFSHRPVPSLLFFSLIVCCACVYLCIQQIRFHQIAHAYLQSYDDDTNGACFQPLLDPFDETILRYLHNYPPYTCPRDELSDLVYVDRNKTVRFYETVRLRVERDNNGLRHSLSCQYFVIERIGKRDSDIAYSSPKPLNLPTIIAADFFKAECLLNDKLVFSRILINIYPPDLYTRSWNMSAKNYNKPNVLILGVDSLSQLNSLRKLNGTNAFLRDNFDTVIMHGYNEIASTTYSNIVPMLTGRSLSELHDDRERPLDGLPFIWKDFNREGYATLYAEDCHADLMTFNNRHLGFIEPPVTHYMRAFWLAIEKEPLGFLQMYILAYEHAFKQSGGSLCYNNKAHYDLMIEYVHRFFHAYRNRPKFATTWFTCPAHEYMNMAEIQDNSFRHMLQELDCSGGDCNTIVIFMSDHGHRTDRIKQTLVGRIEERMPFLSVSLPRHKVMDNYPDALRHLQANRNKLVTVYDIHETLVEIQHGRARTRNSRRRDRVPSSASIRGVSLFQNVPSNRSCSDVEIPHSLCACFNTKSVDVGDEIVGRIALYIVGQLNTLYPLRPPVNLRSVMKSEVIKPRTSLLNVDQSSQWLIRTPVRKVFVFYNLTIKTDHSDSGVFGAMVMYRVDSGKMSLYGDGIRTIK